MASTFQKKIQNFRSAKSCVISRAKTKYKKIRFCIIVFHNAVHMLSCIYLLLEELTLDEVCQLRIIAPCCHLLITGENSLEIVCGTIVQTTCSDSS
jgi:hypothetical protein